MTTYLVFSHGYKLSRDYSDIKNAKKEIEILSQKIDLLNRINLNEPLYSIENQNILSQIKYDPNDKPSYFKMLNIESYANASVTIDEARESFKKIISLLDASYRRERSQLRSLIAEFQNTMTRTQQARNHSHLRAFTNNVDDFSRVIEQSRIPAQLSTKIVFHLNQLNQSLTTGSRNIDIKSHNQTLIDNYHNFLTRKIDAHNNEIIQKYSNIYQFISNKEIYMPIMSILSLFFLVLLTIKFVDFNIFTFRLFRHLFRAKRIKDEDVKKLHSDVDTLLSKLNSLKFIKAPIALKEKSGDKIVWASYSFNKLSSSEREQIDFVNSLRGDYVIEQPLMSAELKPDNVKNSQGMSIPKLKVSNNLNLVVLNLSQYFENIWPGKVRVHESQDDENESFYLEVYGISNDFIPEDHVLAKWGNFADYLSFLEDLFGKNNLKIKYEVGLDKRGDDSSFRLRFSCIRDDKNKMKRSASYEKAPRISAAVYTEGRIQ